MGVKERITAAVFLAAGLVFAFGCGKKADPQKPMEQVEAEIQGMSVSDLESMMRSYADAFRDKRAGMEKLRDEIKRLAPDEVVGEKGREIRDRMKAHSVEAVELMKRYDRYARKFREAGGDPSEIDIG